MNKLIGLTGFARSGKDTFYIRAANYLANIGELTTRFAFADVLKRECDPLLKLNTGISAFTSNPEDKELIRPLLVTYGTGIRRRLDPNCWINKIKEEVAQQIEEGRYVFITDVRFENEAKWIKSQGGLIFDIKREGITAANKDEHDQSKLIKFLIDVKISWPTFGSENLSQCDYFIEQALGCNTKKIFQTETVV